MFGIQSSRNLTDFEQSVADRIFTEPGYNAGDDIASHRASTPIADFELVYSEEVRYDPMYGLEHPDCYFKCPVCGSLDVDDNSIEDYGGTSSGWTCCNFCGYYT